MLSMKEGKAWYKRWWAIALFVLIGLAIIGSFLPNSSNNQVTCNKPYILVGVSCCLDNNANNICDTEEVSQVSSNSNQGNLATEDNSNTQNTQTTTPAVEEESDKATIGEKNALNKALSYLRYTSFSYSGLVKQLEFEKFTHQEAVYGVDNCGADWKEQAALKAQSYLDYSAFSYSGLVKQLEFEGFTKEQTEYGVQAVGY